MKALQFSVDERVSKFRNLVEEFSALAEAEGVSVEPYRGDGPEFFQRLPEALQLSTLQHFEAYVEAAREVRAQGESLHNDQLFLWRMFQKLRAHAPSDFLSQLSSGEVIEIHNSEFVQIYRNLHFFTLCTYTLDDMLCRPFWELYERDESIAQHLIQIAGGVFTGQSTGTQPLSIPEHTILEIDSPGRLLISVQHRIAAPLSNSEGKPVAVLAAVRVPSCVRTAPVLPLTKGVSTHE